MFTPSHSLLVTGLFWTVALAQQQLSATAHALIFSATAEFRHDSIPTAIQTMTSNGSQYNILFDNTEDQTWFKDGRINDYDVLIFLDNTGEGACLRISQKCQPLTNGPTTAVLDDDAQAAFQDYVDAGGNFVGIHSASDCLRNSTFYANELGKLSV